MDKPGIGSLQPSGQTSQHHYCGNNPTGNFFYFFTHVANVASLAF
jgi:hypothetical protein